MPNHNSIVRTELALSSPEKIYEWLKDYGNVGRSGKNSADRTILWPDAEIENDLLARQVPLIDLGLATNAGQPSTIKVLYERSNTLLQSTTPLPYAKGIKVACLSNRTDRFCLSDINRILGPDQIATIFSSEDGEAIRALLINPTVGDDLLVDLYQRKNCFAAMSDEWWRVCVQVSASNPRLVTKKDSRYSGDFGHWSIHQAIFDLLATAPLESDWLEILHDLIWRFDRSLVKTPQNIRPVLDRWAKVIVTDYQGNPATGNYVGLSPTDEFRCLIASLYGKSESFSDYERKNDPVARCVDYATKKLTPAMVEKAMEKDFVVFKISAPFNEAIYINKKLAIMLESAFDLREAHQYAAIRKRLSIAKDWIEPEPLSVNARNQLGIRGQSVRAQEDKIQKIYLRINRILEIDFWTATLVVFLTIAILFHQHLDAAELVVLWFVLFGTIKPFIMRRLLK